MTDIHMPNMSDAMEEGTILTWLKAPGDQVNPGDELVEIETDKATMTYESPATGALEIVAESGSTLSVGAVIARLTSASAEDETAEAAAQRESPPATPRDASPPPPTPAKQTRNAPAVTAKARLINDAEPGIRATPVPRRFSNVHEIDLSELSGSGPRGRVRRVDVERAAGLEPAAGLETTSRSSMPWSRLTAHRAEFNLRCRAEVRLASARRS